MTEQDSAKESEVAAAIEQIEDGIEALQNVSEGDVSDERIELLTDLEKTVKEVENVAEDTRKEVIEPALDDRIGVDETVNGLRRTGRTYYYVRDETGLADTLVASGVDRGEFTEVNRKAAENAAEENDVDIGEFIGENNTTYYRRI